MTIGKRMAQLCISATGIPYIVVAEVRLKRSCGFFFIFVFSSPILIE